jgi:hypothetical protein
VVFIGHFIRNGECEACLATHPLVQNVFRDKVGSEGTVGLVGLVDLVDLVDLVGIMIRRGGLLLYIKVLGLILKWLSLHYDVH